MHGSLTVLDDESNVAIAGIAGLGHMLLTAAVILLFVALNGNALSGAGTESAAVKTGTRPRYPKRDIRQCPLPRDSWLQNRESDH